MIHAPLVPGNLFVEKNENYSDPEGGGEPPETKKICFLIVVAENGGKREREHR